MAASACVEDWLKGWQFWGVPVSIFILFFFGIAPHKKNQTSTASSISSRASAPKPKPHPKPAPKPTEAVANPAKRLKTALSTTSLASSQADSNDTPDNISDDTSTPDVINIVSDAEEDPVDEETLEAQLSESTARPNPFILTLIRFPRVRTKDLALPGLLVLQVQHLRSLQGYSDVSFLPVHCPQLQIRLSRLPPLPRQG